MNPTVVFRPSRRAFTLASAAALAFGPAAIASAKDNQLMIRLVLLGDSVFANAAYVCGRPDVVNQLRQMLPSGWRASLAAVDGSVMADIGWQLGSVPANASHLVVSIGGNDFLRFSTVLAAPSGPVAESMEQLAKIREQFQRHYRTMLETVLQRGLPVAVCTIYDPRYLDPVQRRVGTAGLCIINDGIIREAAASGVPVIDLRVVCGDDADFATPIEPSVRGGSKIATAITSVVRQHDFAGSRCEISRGKGGPQCRCMATSRWCSRARRTVLT
jgi:lysophospholipase L1-like esterase